MFNSNRLALAKNRKRLQNKELAESINKSPITISRLLNSDIQPEPDTVSALAKALGFPEEFFFGDDIDFIDEKAASFRSLTAMTAKEKAAAIAAGSLAYMLSDWVSERFNLPEVDLIDLSHEREPTNAAATLRRYWGLGEKPIGSIIKLLESKGVRVFSLSENTRNVDAFSCWRNNIPYIFLNTYKTAEHSRFDAAHELGHLILHKHGGPHQRASELDANAFASSFLMPKSDVLSYIPFVTSLDQLVKAKKRWKVSVSALAYRLHKLGIVSDWQHRTFCIQINKRYGKNEPYGIEREESSVWKQVFYGLWNERITKDDIARDLHIPLAELENLVFGLVGKPDLQSNQPENWGQPLRAV